MTPDPPVPADTQQSRQAAGRQLLHCFLVPLLIFTGVNLCFLALVPVVYFFLLVRIAYCFNTLIFPLLLIVAGLGALRQRRRTARAQNMRHVALCCFALAAVCFAARIYATHVEPRRLQIRRVACSSPKIERPLRILHISDVQSAGIGEYEKIVFATVAELQPDLILHTGDLLQPLRPKTYLSELPKAAALIRALQPPLGVYSVYGDTDPPLHGVSPEQAGGMIFLSSGGARPAASIEASAFAERLKIQLFGLSLEDSRGGGNVGKQIGEWLQSLDNNVERQHPGERAFTILLGHSPDFILDAERYPLDLCLAGHTHGGQVRLPILGPPVTFSRLPRQWARGFRAIGRTRLNVSAGIGAEHAAGLPSIRFNCPPEITVIDIKPIFD